jgi:Tfp pilus assembly protein PilN
MRPVNLLPAKNRPHESDGSKAGSAYVVIGVLAIFLVAVVAYVLESNKISQAKTDTAVAEQRTAEARAKAQANGPYANFAQVKQQRVDSVKTLADGRFDWERTLRELSLVLPDGVWIQSFTANATGATDGSSTSTGVAASVNPTMMVHGCAIKQPDVAETLLRLKQMEGVNDVTLTDSTRGTETKPSAEGSAQGCGSHGGTPNLDFNAAVEFETPAATTSTGDGKGSKVPVRLGGGS